MNNSGFYGIVRGISMDSIQVASDDNNDQTFIVEDPWNEFIHHLNIYDEIFIVPGSDPKVLDDTAILVIEPRFLVAVSDVLNAISCPRMVYVDHMGAKPINNEFINRRQLEGILLHDTFTNTIVHQNPVKTAVNETLENRKLELIMADVQESSARNYLMTDAIFFDNFSIDGYSEVDLKHYGLGLFGKLDVLSSSDMILELKSSTIPDSIPHANHNIQINLYQDILQDFIGKRPKGKVLYVSDGNMGMKNPQVFSLTKSMVGRNWAYLVLSGKFTPPLLRGEDLRICRSCYKKEGCKSLCAGMKMQRDCDLCYFEHDCDKQAWSENIRHYFEIETEALSQEQLEQKKEEFVGLRDTSSLSASIDTVVCKKLSEETNNRGRFVAEYSYDASDLRYRSGDYLTIYPKTSSEYVEMNFSGKLLQIDDTKLVVESSNSLPDVVEIYPSTTSFLMNRSRETIYKSVISGSTTTKLIIDFLTSDNQEHFIAEMQDLEIEDVELIKPFKNYNKQQLKAIQAGLATHDFAIIQGPAGTGKTSVILELIHQLNSRGKSVLVSAYTNQAVNNIGYLLDDVGIDFLKFGSTPSQLYKYSIEENPDKFRDFVENRKGKIVLATTSTIGKDTYDNLFFDYILVDEASQMTLPNSLMPAIHGEKLILVGDHKQLPPIVISDEARELGLHKSLFERLVPISSRFIMLNEQYRMSDDILSLPNQLFYDDKLRSANAEISSRNLVLKSDILLPDSYQVLAIEELEQSPTRQSNYNELIVIVNLVRELLEDNEIEPEDIGIIAPYRAQIALLRKYIPEIKIDTVDRFQGSESEVIIFSTTTTMDVPILSDKRRVNVALTRAKKKLIILQSNPSSIQENTLMRQIYRDAFRRGKLVDIDQTRLDLLKKRFDSIIKDKGLKELIRSASPISISHRDNSMIFYGSIPLMTIELDKTERCHICYAQTSVGIQCHGCSYLYHEDHLYEWVEQKKKCPICKHKLEIIPL